MKRNLICHIAPLNNPMLDYNLRQIAKYIKVFNGRRIINIAQGVGLLKVSAIQDKMNLFGLQQGRDYEITLSANDSSRETGAFIDNLLPAIKSDDEKEITFFCHAKGITRKDSEPCRRWADFMYRYNLEDIEKVEWVLSNPRYVFAGIFKIGPVPPVVPVWHFSGTFWWFNNARLFKRDWQKIDRQRFGTEAYPATVCAEQEGYCLAYSNIGKDGLLYKEQTWDQIDSGVFLP